MERRMARLALTMLIGFLAVIVAPLAAAAHGGEDHLEAARIVRMWTWDPLVLAGLAVASLIYARGVRALWLRAGPGHGVRRREVLFYTAGLLTIFIALISPLDGLSEALFSAHMSQ